MKNTNPQRGFIALVSAIIISAMLLLLMAGAGLSSFYARFDALGIEDKRQALALAESCANAALLAIATSSGAYAPSEQLVQVDTELSCTIEDVVYVGGDATIHTHASFNSSFASLTVRATATGNPEILFWEETQ